MRVILTGGAGFIGSHMADTLLENGYEVTILDNLSTGRLENLDHLSGAVELIECDLSKEGEWQKHFNQGDWVIHLAALADIVPSIRDPQGYFNSNVQGTFNVLQAAVSAGVERDLFMQRHRLATEFLTLSRRQSMHQIDPNTHML